MKILVLASLRNILELGYHFKSVTKVIQSSIQIKPYYYTFFEISMSRRHAAKITVFLGFCQYFGLDMVYFVAISLHMM